MSLLWVPGSVAGGLARGVVLLQGTDLVVAEGDVQGGGGVGQVLLFGGTDDRGGYDRVAQDQASAI
jgi:hypothetical protein